MSTPGRVKQTSKVLSLDEQTTNIEIGFDNNDIKSEPHILSKRVNAGVSSRDSRTM